MKYLKTMKPKTNTKPRPIIVGEAKTINVNSLPLEQRALLEVMADAVEGKINARDGDGGYKVTLEMVNAKMKELQEGPTTEGCYIPNDWLNWLNARLAMLKKATERRR